MDKLLPIIIPIITLILGYLLNIFADSLNSKRETKRRRILAKEKAYGEISMELHRFFEIYRVEILQKTRTLTGKHTSKKPNPDTIPEKYDKLMQIVFQHNLYLSHEMTQDLLDLKYIDYRARENSHFESKEEYIYFLENHADNMWSKAKEIINEMREDLNLGKYPDNMLKFWR